MNTRLIVELPRNAQKDVRVDIVGLGGHSFHHVFLGPGARREFYVYPEQSLRVGEVPAGAAERWEKAKAYREAALAHDA